MVSSYFGRGLLIVLIGVFLLHPFQFSAADDCEKTPGLIGRSLSKLSFIPRVSKKFWKIASKIFYSDHNVMMKKLHETKELGDLKLTDIEIQKIDHLMDLVKVFPQLDPQHVFDAVYGASLTPDVNLRSFGTFLDQYSFVMSVVKNPNADALLHIVGAMKAQKPDINFVDEFNWLVQDMHIHDSPPASKTALKDRMVNALQRVQDQYGGHMSRLDMERLVKQALQIKEPGFKNWLIRTIKLLGRGIYSSTRAPQRLGKKPLKIPGHIVKIIERVLLETTMPHRWLHYLLYPTKRDLGIISAIVLDTYLLGRVALYFQSKEEEIIKEIIKDLDEIGGETFLLTHYDQRYIKYFNAWKKEHPNSDPMEEAEFVSHLRAQYNEFYQYRASHYNGDSDKARHQKLLKYPFFSRWQHLADDPERLEIVFQTLGDYYVAIDEMANSIRGDKKGALPQCCPTFMKGWESEQTYKKYWDQVLAIYWKNQEKWTRDQMNGALQNGLRIITQDRLLSRLGLNSRDPELDLIQALVEIKK